MLLEVDQGIQIQNYGCHDLQEPDRCITGRGEMYFKSFKVPVVESSLYTVECADYYQVEDGPRHYGIICIATNWLPTLYNSLMLKCLEVD